MGAVFGRITVDTPPYETLKTTDAYEIRKYGSLLLAEVRPEDLPEKAAGKEFDSAAFRILAAYIGVFGSPKNETAAGKEKSIPMTAPVISEPQSIPMTAPVISDPTSAQRTSLQFVLPADMKLDTAPRPLDSRVHLKETEPRTVAVSTFSGVGDSKTAAEEARKLFQALEKDGVAVVDRSSWQLARYNAPFTIPWFRTNEIYVPLKEE